MTDPLVKRAIEQVQARRAASPDGFARSADMEERINMTCRNVLTGAEGEALMDYLRSITTNAVLPPSASDAELRDMEGMRRLVGILDARRRSTPSRS